MHDNLVFGFEMLFVGLAIVMTTLLVLAFILFLFNKIFYKEGGGSGPNVTETFNKVASGKNMNNIKLSPAAEIASANSASQQATVRPEIVAASLGALLFAMEAEKKSFKKDNSPAPSISMWAQTGRAKALNLRQDFVLLRRGKNR